MSKVVVSLDGGLGNQMFQYAAGRALALRLGKPLALDAGKLSRRNQRAYGLGDFQLRAHSELTSERTPTRWGKLGRWFGKLAKADRTFREASFAFDERIRHLKAPARLEGYFQSERYFMDAAPFIRDDFRPREELRAGLDSLAAELLPEGASISLHVRRGDYADPAVMAVHGLAERDYYERALRVIAERGAKGVVCVFTDDPAWVRANLPLPTGTRFISERTRSALEDLILMSRCTHHITANSSFSWWGAWLNPRPEKIVVTPERWFQPSAGLDTRDLRPAGWLQA
jgi:hypothetical protein